MGKEFSKMGTCTWEVLKKGNSKAMGFFMIQV